MNKSQIISLLVTIGASIDTFYGVFADNLGLLAELGLSPKITKIIMLLGLLWTAFSKSLTAKKVIALKEGEGAGTPTKAP